MAQNPIVHHKGWEPSERVARSRNANKDCILRAIHGCWYVILGILPSLSRHFAGRPKRRRHVFARKSHVSPGVERNEFTLVASRCADLRSWKDLTMFTKSEANYRSHFRV